MKVKKRVFPIIVAVLMILTALPVSGAQTAFASGDEIILTEPGAMDDAALTGTGLDNEADPQEISLEGDTDLPEISLEDDATLPGTEQEEDGDLPEISLEDDAELPEINLADENAELPGIDLADENASPEISLAEEPELIRIGSAEDWETFCDAVNHAGQTPVNAELTQDVTLTEESSMAGENVENYFSGVFDGNGYTLTLNYVSNKRIAPIKHAGGGALIRNLRTAGSITMTSSGSDAYHSSGMVSGAEGPVTIRGCTSSVDLRFASYSSSVYAGGFIGHAGYCQNLTIEDCIFDGSIGYIDGAISKPGLHYVSGFVPWGDSFRLTMNNCVNTGTVSDVGSYYPIAYTNGSNQVKNCMYIYPGATCYGPGSMAVTVSGEENLSLEIESSPAIIADEVNYYTSPVAVRLTPLIPEGAEFLKYTVNSGTIDDEETMEGTHMISGFSRNIVLGYKVKDVANTIIIRTADDWEELCELVAGLNSETLLNVELANDISITEESTLLGTNASPFAGTFDGKGHTLHLQMVGSQQNVAPFAQVEDAVIKNLNTDGTVISTVSNDQSYHHSGLIGGCVGDVEVLNCNVGAEILFPSGTTKVYSGGVIGHGGRANIRMEGCTFTGNIGYLEDAASKPGLQRVGGLIGWGDSMRVEMVDCFDLGTFDQVLELSPLVRGGTSSLRVENSYYIGTSIPNTSEYAHDCGTAMITVESDDGVLLTINDEPFMTYKNTDYYLAPVNVTLEPVLPEGKVFEKYIVNSGEISDPDVAEGEHLLKNSKVPVVVSRIIRSIEADYLISDADDWAEFCEAVNAGTGDVIVQAALVNDVTLTPESPSAGNDSHPFSGVFDGRGHILTINYEGTKRYAPFIRVDGGALIHDLHTAGTITLSGTESNIIHSSGLIGSCPGDVTIQNCISSVNLRFASGFNKIYSAGFIGHTNSAKVVMEDCVFDGSIGYVEGAANKPGLSNVGGLIAWGEYASRITMKNCLNIGTYEDVANLCPIIRNSGSASVTDCYYTYTGIPMLGERVLKYGTLVAAVDGEEDLVVSGEPVCTYDDVAYYSETTPLTFTLQDAHPDAFTGYTASSGRISNPTVREGEHTISGFTEKTVTVKAHWGDDDPYAPEGFYTPLSIAEGFNKDGILEEGDNAQVEFIDGASNGEYGFYAIPDRNGSLPIDGVIGTATGRYFILGDYAQKNVLVLDKNNRSANLVLDESSRGAYTKLAFLVTGGTGGGTAEVTVHLSNPDDPSDTIDVPLEIEAPDWNYTASGKETVYNCGRVYVPNHSSYDSNAIYGLYEGAVDLSGEEYEGYIVTSATVNVKTLSEAAYSTICIFAVSGIDTDTCTVLFEGNGGVAAQKMMQVEPGEDIQLPDVEEREGYAFVGWYDGETKVGDPGDSYTVNTDVVLSAEWMRVGQVTLTIGVYDFTNDKPGQGGTYTFNDEDMAHTADRHTVEIDSPVKLVAAPAEGYVFMGWCVGWILEGTDELQIVPDSMIELVDPVVETYASDNAVICAVFRETKDTPLTIDASTLQITVPKERESDRVVTSGDKINVSVKITDYDGVEGGYAVFGNDAEDDEIIIELLEQEDDIWAGVLDIDDEMSLGDWALAGISAWDVKEYEETYLLNSAVMDPEEWWPPVTIVFVDCSAFDFEVRKSFTVTFDSWGGSEVAPQRVIEGHTAVKPQDPVKEGLRLDRWYSDEDLTDSYSFSTPVNKNLTLYAGWVADMSLGVYNRSNPGGNSAGTVDIETSSHSIGFTDVGTGNYTIPESFVAFTAKPADGFVFRGWYQGIVGESSFVEEPSEELLTEDDVFISLATEAAICAVFECAGHQWEQKIQKATPNAAGRIYEKCKVCGAEETIAPLLQVSNIHLEKTSFTYTGKAIEPKVIVANASEELSADCYTLKYSNNVEAGTGSVKVTLKGDYYEGSKTLKFTIKPVAVEKIKLNRTSMEMATKTTAQLKVTFTPANPSDKGLTWTSNNPEVATVDQNGKVSALTRGTATITVTSKSDKTKKATCKLTVKYHDAYYDLDGTGQSNVTKEMETAINWAADNKITGEKEAFGTKNSMTRGQFVRFLYRYAGNPKVTSAMIKTYGAQFSDVDKNYTHFNAIVWAVSQGLIDGYSDGTFKPNKTLSRNNVATILWKFAGSPKVSNANNPFSDVKKSAAIAWGKSKKIFTGSTFKPKDNCLRGDFAVFLYRYDKKVGKK